MKKDREKLVSDWQERIQKQTDSGDSIAAWCRGQSISYNTFMYWRNQLRQRIPNNLAPSSFVEIPGESEKWIKIIMEGAMIEITKNFDRGALLFCLKVLGGH